MMQRNLEDLKLGTVDANFTFVSNAEEQQRWAARGFISSDAVPTIGADEGDISLIGMPLRLCDEQEKYTGRKIIGLETYFGTYGMGGAGFLGIQLDCDEDETPSWIIFCLWSSERHTRLNGKPFQDGDEDRAKIVGSTVTAIEFLSDSVAFSLAKAQQTTTLAFCYTLDAKDLIINQIGDEPLLDDLVLAIYDGSNLLV